MAAVLSRNLTDITKLTGFMEECKSMKIAVKGPDVNESFSKFGVNSKGDIRFGLSAIKGIGPNVVDEIIAARGKEPFKDIFDFVERVPTKAINRRILENLAISGAFDCFEEVQREDFLESNSKDETLGELLVRYGAKYQQKQVRQEASLFSFDELTEDNDSRPAIKHAVPWIPEVKYSKERELVGMYLSGHPLDPYYMEIKYGMDTTIGAIDDIAPADGLQFSFGGMVTSFETKQARNGGTFGIIKFEDFTDTTEMRLFGKQLLEFGKYGVPGTPVKVTCAFRKRYNSEEINLNITNIELLEDFKGHVVSGITIKATVEQVNDQLRQLLIDHRKSSTTALGSLNLRLFDPSINRSVLLQSGMRIPVNRKLLRLLDDLDIEYNIEK